VLGLTLEEKQGAAAEAAPFIDLLVRTRADLRAAKQYALADKLRQDLSDLGIILEDSPTGTTWRWEK
jgi:cysteinyl-tRNA synthetase